MLALLVSSAPSLQAPPPRPPGPPPVPHLVPPYLQMGEELGLDEGQRARLKAVLDAHRATMRARQEAIREAHEALVEAVREGGDLESLNRAFAARQLSMLLEARTIQGECAAILTRDQLRRAKELSKRGPGGPPEEEGHRGEHETRPGRRGPQDR